MRIRILVLQNLFVKFGGPQLILFNIDNARSMYTGRHWNFLKVFTNEFIAA